MKTCWNCGEMVPDTAKFCRDCGAKLTDQGDEDRTVIIQEPEEPAPVYEEPAYEEPVYEQPVYEEHHEEVHHQQYAAGGYRPQNQEDYRYHTNQESQQARAQASQQSWQQANQQGWQQERPQAGQQAWQQESQQSWQQANQQAWHQESQQGWQQTNQNQQARQPKANETPNWDHTSEFTAKDISENKVVAMLIYLLGWVGIIIALLAGNQSPYAAFHVRQGLKFVVLDCLIGIAAVAVLVVILPFGLGGALSSGDSLYAMEQAMAATGGLLAFAYIVLGLFSLVLGIVKIICFFSICKGNAKEPPIVRAFGFMK